MARITELSNVITARLDAATPAGMLRLLRQTDAQVPHRGACLLLANAAQIFHGWDVHASLFDAEHVKTMEAIAEHAADLIAVCRAVPSASRINPCRAAGARGRTGAQRDCI